MLIKLCSCLLLSLAVHSFRPTNTAHHIGFRQRIHALPKPGKGKVELDTFIDDVWDALKVYGFDTFTGLPEGWYFFKKGDFDLKGELPDVPDNVELVKGLFNESLPRFLANKTARPQSLDNFSYIHIDCDLYAGAKDALMQLNDMIVPGTLLLFDELVGYEGYKDHEVKALYEWLHQYNRKVQVLGKLCDPAEGPFEKNPTVPKEWFQKNATWEQSVAMVVLE